jgi:hypothetical protein
MPFTTTTEDQMQFTEDPGLLCDPLEVGVISTHHVMGGGFIAKMECADGVGIETPIFPTRDDALAELLAGRARELTE